MNSQSIVALWLVSCLVFPLLGGAVSSSPVDPLLDEILKPAVTLEDYDRPLPPSPANPHYQQGLRYLRDHQEDAARNEFHQALQQDPQHLPTKLALARLALQQKKFGEAEQQVREAIQIAPRSADLHVAMAQVRLVQGKVSEAEQELQKAIELDPDASNPRLNLGNLYNVQGKTDAALQEYQAAMKRHPHQLEPQLAEALTYAYTGKLDQAVSATEKLLTLFPQNPTVLALRGFLYVEQQQYAPAIEKFQAAIAADYRYVPAHLGLGDVYLRQQNEAAAIQSYQTAISVDPNAGRAHLMLGSVYALEGETQKATEAFETVLQLPPDARITPIAQNNLAWVYAEQGEKLDEAIQLAESAAKLAPHYLEIRDTLGWAYYKKGEYPEALQNLQQVVQAETRDPMVYYHLGMVYLKLGEESKARDAFQHALKLNPQFAKAAEVQALLGK